MNYFKITLFIALSFVLMMCSRPDSETLQRDDVLLIKKTDDFEITGDGSAEEWSKTEWVQIEQLNNHDQKSYETRAKVLYSDTGIYILFDCEDEKITATMDEDFMELWNEDVVEVFLWPDQSTVTYFEYELSPLNYELPILVSNKDGNLAHWQPYRNSYVGDRKVRHKTSVQGGEKESMAEIERWTAEIFIPFDLLRPLQNIHPQSGTRWRGNLYRIDYDEGQTLFAWQPINRTYHEYEKFGTFLFE